MYLFKVSDTAIHPTIYAKTDTGYQSIAKIHPNTLMPKKRSKNHPLTKADKEFNRRISRQRVFVEHVIGFIKRFKIIAERYRNRRKRFCLRFNLIAGICNFER